MAETYCPFLKREAGRLYVCNALNKEVNPLVMPCLSRYEDCVVYKAYEERAGIEVAASPEAESPSIEAEVSEKIVASHITNEKISEFEQLLRSFHEEAVKVSRLREEYREAVRRLKEHYERIQKLVGELMASMLKEVPEIASEE